MSLPLFVLLFAAVLWQSSIAAPADNVLGVLDQTDHSVEVCLSQAPHQQYELLPSSSELYLKPDFIYVFLDQQFICEGRLESIQFYAEGSGEFCFTVYEPNYRDNTVTQVGGPNDCISVESSDHIQSFDLPTSMLISIRTNYVIGFYYRTKQNAPVVKYVNSNTPGVNFAKLGNVVKIPRNPTNLKHNQAVSFGTADMLQGALAFKGVVVGNSINLKLNPGVCNLTDGGRAEMYMYGTWGTICDKWFHQLGWPQLFCRQMGYPGAYYSFYAQRSEDEPLPIHQMSPRCKDSLGHGMGRCPLHTHGDCDHKSDLCVMCRKKAELRYGAVAESEGFAFRYLPNWWGYVCDQRDLEALSLSGETLWPEVLCKTLGFHGYHSFKHINDVDPPDSVRNIMEKYAATLMNPTCEENAERIEQCSSNGRCDHTNVYYLICETSHG